MEKDELAQEREIARQLANSFDQSKDLVNAVTQQMEKSQSPLAAVAFMMCVVDDMLNTSYPSAWTDSKKVVAATFHYMKEMGAFVPDEMKQ